MIPAETETYQALETAAWCPVWDGLFMEVQDKQALAAWLRDQAEKIEDYSREENNDRD